MLSKILGYVTYTEGKTSFRTSYVVMLVRPPDSAQGIDLGCENKATDLVT